MGELKKLRIAGTENTVTPYTAGEGIEISAGRQVSVDTDVVATKTDLNGKVDKVSGKGLSTNDFTTAEKNKLAGIEAQANKTVVDSALSGTSTNPLQNKVVTEELNDVKADLSELSSSIAPVESSATAIAAHAVGELFMMGETLMVALSAIAIGDTITTEGGSPNAAVTKLTDKLIKDVQVNGTSVVSQGVANIPIARTTLGLVKQSTSRGVRLESDGTLEIRPAGDDYIKVGTSTVFPLTPHKQHAATFYGLAKAAGDTSQSASSNPVGTYTDAAKVAIQKMLGIYEAPWELIRDDTFTLSTSGNIEISVDDNGQPFELTDVYGEFILPTQDADASVASYGRVRFYVGNSNVFTLYMGAWNQNAGATARSASQLIEQKSGAVNISYTKNATFNGEPYVTVLGINPITGGTSRLIISSTEYIFTKIVYEAIIGTAKVRLFGRRNWS